MLRIGSILCAVLACGMLAWAAFSALRSQPTPDLMVEHGELVGDEANGLALENPDQDLGQLPAGWHPVYFRIVNRSSHDAELIGATEKCIAGCCFYMKGLDRLPIRAGATVEVEGQLSVNDEPFEYRGRLYLNESGRFRSLGFKLRGTGVPAERANATP